VWTCQKKKKKKVDLNVNVAFLLILALIEKEKGRKKGTSNSENPKIPLNSRCLYWHIAILLGFLDLISLPNTNLT
jgi:hypothetical protein